MIRKFAWALGAFSIGLSTPAIAGSDAVTEAVNHPARSDANRQLDESRQPATILEFSDLEEGDVVVDFMAGGGYFTEMIADIVGKKGRVYALNPPAFHDPKAWNALTEQRGNISTMAVPVKQQLLAPSSIDTIFTHLTFHDLYWESEQFKFEKLNVPFMLSNWQAALKPGGTVIVVDHFGPSGDTRDIVARLHRIDRGAVIAAMESAGFALAGESDALHRSNDDIEKLVFDPEVQGKTSRFMLKFSKM